MFHGDFDDHIWDEHQWEAHLNEIEKKSAQLRKFIAPDPSGNKPRWFTLLQENSDELEAVDAFIEEELQIEEAYFPDDEDDWEDEEDWEDDLDDFFIDELEDDYLFDEWEEGDDFDEGEEWKELSEDYAMSDYGSIETLDIFNDARELGAYVLQWAEDVPAKKRNNEYNEFVSQVLKISAKIASGYSFGFEQYLLGGNIAYTKKALYCANQSLVLLQNNLKQPVFFKRAEYTFMHGRLFDLRNSIGIYVQELRERFNLGLE
jgi:hypothetical protein